MQLVQFRIDRSFVNARHSGPVFSDNNHDGRYVNWKRFLFKLAIYFHILFIILFESNDI